MRGFLDWKMIATIIITLGMLLFVLGNHPVVQGFFFSLKEKISVPKDTVSRNVSFSILLDKRLEISFDAKGSDMTIEPSSLSGIVAGTNFSTDKRIVIKNFVGNAAVNKSISLKGTFDSLQVEGFLFVNSKIDASGVAAITIGGLALDKLQLEGSGKIFVDGMETKLENQKVVLESPKGGFVIGNETEIQGLAKRIFIGERFVIG